MTKSCNSNRSIGKEKLFKRGTNFTSAFQCVTGWNELHKKENIARRIEPLIRIGQTKKRKRKQEEKKC